MPLDSPSAGLVRQQPLTAKRRAFVAAFVVDENGTQAAIAAGFAERSAATTANRLLKEPKIQEAILAERDSLAKRNRIDQDRIVQAYAEVAFFSIAKHLNKDGSIDLSNLSQEELGALSDIKQISLPNGATHTQVKAHDKLKALEGLSRILGLNEPEKHAHLHVHTQDRGELARRLLGIMHAAAQHPQLSGSQVIDNTED